MLMLMLHVRAAAHALLHAADACCAACVEQAQSMCCSDSRLLRRSWRRLPLGTTAGAARNPASHLCPPACLLPPPLQVTINLRECVVEDFDSASQPSQRRSTQKLDTKGGGSVSLLIRVSHKVGGRVGGWVVCVCYRGGCGWLCGRCMQVLCAGAGFCLLHCLPSCPLPHRLACCPLAHRLPCRPPTPLLPCPALLPAEPRHVCRQEPPPDHPAGGRRGREV